jgi:hypothetical protein
MYVCTVLDYRYVGVFGDGDAKQNCSTSEWHLESGMKVSLLNCLDPLVLGSDACDDATQDPDEPAKTPFRVASYRCCCCHFALLFAPTIAAFGNLHLHLHQNAN